MSNHNENSRTQSEKEVELEGNPVTVTMIDKNLGAE